MSKEDDKAFQDQLRSRYAAGASATGEVMRQPPTGPRKSINQMLADAAPNAYASDEVIGGNATMAGERSPSTSGDNPEDLVHDLQVHLVIDSPYQPRGKYDEAGIIDLGNMLTDRGQDEPIVVRKMADGRFELISGHRRIRAARLIGWATIKGRIRVLDDTEAQIATLTANEGRKDLSDYERAKTYRIALKEGLATSQAAVGRMFGRSQARVSQCLALLDLPSPVLTLLDDYPDLIGYRFVPVIGELTQVFPDSGEVIKKALLGLIEKPDLSPDDIRSIVQKECKAKPTPVKKPKPLDVQNDDGQNVFKVKSIPEKYELVITLDPDMGDFDLASKKIVANLREIAKKGKS